MVEGSMFIGYALVFLSRATEWLLARSLSSRFLLTGVTTSLAVSSLATGLIYSCQNNIVVIAVSTAIRIVQGCLSYACSLLVVDFIHAQFGSKFDLVYGLLNMGYYGGHGLAESVGCVLFDHYGYLVPFIFACSVTLLSSLINILVIPGTHTNLYSQRKITSTDVKEDSPILNAELSQERSKTRSNSSNPPSNPRLSPMLIIPVSAAALINMNYGVLQVTVTPFVHDEIGTTISYGGIVLAFTSIGMATSACTTGMLLQRKTSHPFTNMAIGAFLVALGLFLTFPPRSLPILYNSASILSFPGAFLAGFGDPLMTLSCLRAMCDLQAARSGPLSAHTQTLITGIWLMAYSAFYYSGSFMAGLMLDYFSFSDTAEILAAGCLLAVAICIALRLLVRDEKTVLADRGELMFENDNIQREPIVTR